MKKISIDSKKEYLGKEISIKNSFVGREELITDFFNDYYSHEHSLDSWQLSVTNYYGIPGIGKSKLLYKIYEVQEERGLKALFYRFDNNVSVLDNVVSFRCALGEKYNYRFALFDMAYVYYCKVCGKKIEGKHKSSILDNKFMNTVLPFFQLTKYAPAASLVEAIKPFENEWFTSISEKDFSFLRMSPDDIEDVLMQYFIRDLSIDLKNNGNPMVVCIDNITKVNNSFYEWFLSPEGIICSTPYIVWAMASNEIIKDDEDEQKYIRNVRMEGLEYDDVNRYLTDNNIDIAFLPNVYQVTAGIPLYVEMIVKKIIQSDSDEIFDLSTKDKKQWIEDYYFKISEEKKKALKVLSLNDTWQKEELLMLFDKLKINNDDYEFILEQSYVQGVQGKVALHQVIKDIVQTNMSKSECISLLAEAEKVGIKTDDYYLFSYMKNLYNAKNEIELINVINSGYSIEKHANDNDRILAFHQKICEFLKYKKCFCLMLSYCYVAEMYKEIGLFRNMKEYMSAAYEIADHISCPNGMTNMLFENYLLNTYEQYAFSLQMNNFYSESKQIRERIIERAIKLSGSKSFLTLNSRQNYYNSLVDMGECCDEIEGKIKYLIKQRKRLIIKDAHERALNVEYIVAAKQLLCRVYSERNEPDKKIIGDCVMDMLDSAKEISDASRVHTIVDMFLCKLLLDSRLYDVKFILDLKNRIEMTYDKNSDVVESINYALGIAYGETGDYEKGAEILRDLYAKSYDRNGEAAKDTLRFKKEYALCISQGGDHLKALELLQECRDVYKNVYGEDESEQFINIIRSIELEEDFMNDAI